MWFNIIKAALVTKAIVPALEKWSNEMESEKWYNIQEVKKELEPYYKKELELLKDDNGESTYTIRQVIAKVNQLKNMKIGHTLSNFIKKLEKQGILEKGKRHTLVAWRKKQ